MAALTAAFGDTGKTCGACHDKFRAKAELSSALTTGEEGDGIPVAFFFARKRKGRSLGETTGLLWGPWLGWGWVRDEALGVWEGGFVVVAG